MAGFTIKRNGRKVASEPTFRLGKQLLRQLRCHAPDDAWTMTDPEGREVISAAGVVSREVPPGEGHPQLEAYRQLTGAPRAVEVTVLPPPGLERWA